MGWHPEIKNQAYQGEIIFYQETYCCWKYSGQAIPHKVNASRSLNQDLTRGTIMKTHNGITRDTHHNESWGNGLGRTGDF